MSTLKVDTIATRTGSGNITASNTIAGNVTGDVTGNVTGNVTGDVTGNITGNLTGNVTGNLTGNSTVGGTLGVTGLITASSGLSVGSGGAANTIDDYEEGTWTARLIGSTASPSTPINITSNYTKIGNVVHAYCVFSNVNTTGATGAIRVTGLPYASNGICVNSGTMLYSRFSVPADGFVHPYVASTLTQIRFYYSKSASAWGEVAHSAGTAFYLWSGVTYKTNS